MTNGTSAAGIGCCLALSLVLQDKVSLPGSHTYTASLSSYFSLQESAVHPLCIVSPQSVEDVSAAVNVLTMANKSFASEGCHFAIRSGGHASFAGAANIQDGVTLDLSGLDSISLEAHGRDPQSSAASSSPVVSVGSGATWGAVYAYLDPLNLSVSGGRAANVGVGGLLLGGGISYFGPQFGWACDTVASAQVVLSNGSIITVSEAENADLLWALRGGTNNFGIVTRVDLQTFEQGDLWGGFVDHAYSTTAEQVVALSAFSNHPATYDNSATLITTFAYSGAQNISVVVNNMEYTKPVVDPSVFQILTSIPALASTQRIANLSDLATETAESDANGFREATATLTISPTVAAINATVRAWEASLPLVHEIPGIEWSVGFDPLPPSLYARHAHANALGLDNRDGRPLLIAQLTMTWMDAADDETIDRAARALMAAIHRDVDELGDLDPFVYINYAAPWQNPFAGYGEASLERLRAVGLEYDPSGAFTELVPGGFKIPQ